MNPRYSAIENVSKYKREWEKKISRTSQDFGSMVFNRAVMQRMLPREVYHNIVNAMEGKERIQPAFADIIAVAMKEWAVSYGATHYCHWFQPLTGAGAEKHDSFIDWNTPDKVIEKFNGKQLLQGEPDASSFPSGGLRSTYEARGYTGWDPSSPVFLWRGGDGVTLCIPSIFFSWTGEVLDNKIPLLRSDKVINEAALRLIKLTGIDAKQIFSTLGSEQEYFVIDRSLRNLRPDLVLCGRTVFGAPPPKGQELQDHYFGAVKDRILRFMHEFEELAIELAIPVKTRHNEVAPAQHEIAPVFEKASAAIDHNIILMELMRQIAVKHDLACLLHEKPFHNLNGSGKHCNWSLSTDTGINLLDPTDTPGNNLHFLILLTAILNAVHRHSVLLRASIGSAANDYRLGGHEAPPAIISVYLGGELEALLDDIESKGGQGAASKKDKYNLGIPVIPDLSKDNTDRNRTSPFAFTGNKFEFRAVGSSANPSMAITVLNAIVAESLNEIMDKIEKNVNKGHPRKKELAEAAIPVLRKYIKQSKGIRFHGDNYSKEWREEAKRRGLPNIAKSIDAFESYRSPSTIKAFANILSPQELQSRFEIVSSILGYTHQIETNLMLDMFRSQILPASMRYQKEVAKSILQTGDVLGKKNVSKTQIAYLKKLNKAIDSAIEAADELDAVHAKAKSIVPEELGKFYSHQVSAKCEALREAADQLELFVDDALWPLPKYREMLFLV